MSLAVGIAAFSIGATRSGPQAPPPMRALVYEHEGWVYRARLDGAKAVRLVRGEHPQISPDGRWIAFHRARSAKTVDVRVMPSSGGPSSLVRAGATNSEWMPDSSRLLVYDRRAATIVDRTGAHPRVLFPVRTSDGVVYSVSISPTGDRIAYVLAGYTGADVFLVSLDGSESVRLTNDRDSSSAILGRELIAFKRFTRGVGSDVWVMNVDGTNPRQVTFGAVGLYPLYWLPDGRRIVAYNPGVGFSGPNYGQLWVVDLDDGTRRSPAPPLEGLVPLGSSRDGRTILVRTGCFRGFDYTIPGAIQVIPVGGGRMRTLVRGPCDAHWNA